MTIDEETCFDGAPAVPHTPHALYALADVETALGEGADARANDLDEVPWEEEGGGSTVRRARLRRMLQNGEGGRWRRLAHATPEAVDAVAGLGRRAPHLHEATDLVLRRLTTSLAVGVPFVLPPLVLLGPPGLGKTWYLAHLAAVLGLPFRLYPFALSTLGEGLSGSHPSWRASAPGLVARTLLMESIANPLVLVDELDKPPHPAHSGGDPYRPFYAALEPSCSRAWVDEHLGVPFDAGRVSWVASANDLGAVPAPIVDRLTVIAVPAMRLEERVAVVESIYAEANAAFRHHFDPHPHQGAVERLASLGPRRARLAIEDAMTRAAVAGRRAVLPEDVPVPQAARARGVVH